MTRSPKRYPYIDMLMASAKITPHMMLRGPQVFFSEPPDPEPEPEAEEVPEHFREQPGDREGGEEGDSDPDPEPEPEPEGDEDGDEEEGADEEDGEEPPASDEPPAERKTDWKDRQIAKLRDKQAKDAEEREELRKRAEAAEALLAATPEERTSALADDERERIRKEEAAKLTEQARFTTLGNNLEKLHKDGLAAFPNTWEGRSTQAREAIGEEMGNRPDFLEALVDLPNTPQVYHHLAGDLDEVERLLSLPAHKMGMELARLSDKLAKPAPRERSKAPPPIRPLERGGSERDLEDLINDPNASMAEIDRRMRAEEKRRAKAN